MGDDKIRKILYPAIVIWAVALLSMGLYVKLIQQRSEAKQFHPTIPKSLKDNEISSKSTNSDVDDAVNSTSIVGKKLPAFEVKRYGGGTIKSKDLIGTPTVIEFFASWCPHCRRMAPIMDRQIKRNPKVRYVMINAAREKESTVVDWYETFLGKPMRATLGFDSTLTAAKKYGVSAYPTMAFIDRSGKVLYLSTGELTESAVRTKLNSIAAE